MTTRPASPSTCVTSTCSLLSTLHAQGNDDDDIDDDDDDDDDDDGNYDA